MTSHLEGIITAKEEFLFPDSICGDLPRNVHAAAAGNGNTGVQILLKTKGTAVELKLDTTEFEAEYFQMLRIPVEYNTGDGREQGGAMVILPEEKPFYAVRKAPFEVFDCLKPVSGGRIEAEQGLAAVYLCIAPKPWIKPGNHMLRLFLQTEEGGHACDLEIYVADVEIPEGNFQVTNWFNLDSICRFHQVEQGTEAFYHMLEQYAQAMRRAKQTMFYLELDDTCVKSKNPYIFDFSYLERMIEIFFAAGMETLEIGPVLSRGFLENGMPDMYTEEFRCAMAPEIDVDSFDGYRITTGFIQALAEFLKQHGWEEKVVVHIHDEPDVHYKDERTLQKRKRQYFQAAAILKKYLPKARTIEAVKTTEFRGGIDIWVPVSSSFEEEKAAFTEMMELGEEVWNYVCCVPQGNWLNRFLDEAVLHSRLMFWGYEKYGITGYLHWGFNVFQMGMNPFEATSCPNHTGIGTNFPCGDAFIVYPGSEAPWYSMRLEAQRRGVEDAELLMLLRKRNPKLHDELIAEVFTDYSTYVDDEAVFAGTYEKLLKALEN